MNPESVVRFGDLTRQGIVPVASLPHLIAVDGVARALIAEYAPGAALRWDTARNRAGQWRYARPGRMSLSAALMAHWEPAPCEEIIRHELAHALAGPRVQAHGAEWAAACVRLGIRPARCWSPGDGQPRLPSRYVGRCAAGHLHFRNRLTAKAARVSCYWCSPAWNPAYSITWEERERAHANQ